MKHTLLILLFCGACAEPLSDQASRVRNAAALACDAAEDWAPVNDEIRRLHELCETAASAPVILDQFQLCLGMTD